VTSPPTRSGPCSVPPPSTASAVKPSSSSPPPLSAGLSPGQHRGCPTTRGPRRPRPARQPSHRPRPGRHPRPRAHLEPLLGRLPRLRALRHDRGRHPPRRPRRRMGCPPGQERPARPWRNRRRRPQTQPASLPRHRATSLAGHACRAPRPRTSLRRAGLRAPGPPSRPARAITRTGASQIVKRAARTTGLVGDYTSHSLRAGLVSDALDAGVTREQVQRHGRWANIGSIDPYYRKTQSWRQTNPPSTLPGTARSPTDSSWSSPVHRMVLHCVFTTNSAYSGYPYSTTR
jgi:hypothetical protein